MVELHIPDSPEHLLNNSSRLSYRKLTGNGVNTNTQSEKESHAQLNVNWGRDQRPSWLASLSSLGITILSPLLTIICWVSLNQYDGSLFNAFVGMYLEGPWEFMVQNAPSPSLKAFEVYAAWVLFQAALYQYLPSRLSTGQLTPAGHLLQYHTNGLLAWVVTHVLFVLAVCFGVVDPAWIAKNWAGLLVAANAYGSLVSGFAYVKAYLAPTHARDRKFSGSIIYDFYMGIEFNPRFGQFFDFKFFHVGRVGMIAWTLVNLSFTAYQYELHGMITNSIIIVNILHALYCIDFYINEDWYLRTIDICHDHFGFYIGWASVAWLPTMYTLQAQYLAYHPVILSPLASTAVLWMGIGGYVIFRSVNYQKDLVRRTKGDCEIWGRPAGVQRCRYRTADGMEHESLLLYTGWWGVSRHANYLGDLILSYSMCATCGFEHVLPWFYAVFMTVLLLHRSTRTEQSCAAKYGEDWDKYCEKVRWVLIPGIY